MVDFQLFKINDMRGVFAFDTDAGLFRYNMKQAHFNKNDMK